MKESVIERPENRCARGPAASGSGRDSVVQGRQKTAVARDRAEENGTEKRSLFFE